MDLDHLFNRVYPSGGRYRREATLDEVRICLVFRKFYKIKPLKKSRETILDEVRIYLVEPRAVRNAASHEVAFTLRKRDNRLYM